MNGAKGVLAIAAGLVITASARGSDRLGAVEVGTAPSSIDAAAPPAAARSADFKFGGQLTQGGWLRGTAPRGTVALTIDGTPVALAADGLFFIGFDRDAAPAETLSARFADGRVASRRIAISPRAWAIEQLDVARRTGGPSEAFMTLRRPELAQIAAARAMRTGAEGWRQNFVWPVTGRISGKFGSQRVYRGEPGAYHSGIDIATGTSGTVFVAPADGTVVLAAKSPFTLEGNLLMIDHGDGLGSAFLHCSAILVKQGDRVRRGQPIGRIGMTGRATGPHLHWSVTWKGWRLDPILLTGPMR